MNKREFLKKLESCLANYLSSSELLNEMNYYENYINEEIKKGKTEIEVINELGDPSLIAKTIKQLNTSADDDVIDQDYNSNNTNNQNSYDNNYNDFDDEYANKNNEKYTRVYDKTGLTCSLIAIILLIILFVFLRIFGFLIDSIFTLLGPVGIIIVILLFYLFNKRK